MSSTKQPQSLGFVKQATILTLAGLGSRLIGFIYRLPLTGMIGDEGNGIYAVGFNIYMFLLIMSSSGLPAAISKMVSERVAEQNYRGAGQVFRVSMRVALALGLFFSVALLVFDRQICAIMGYPRSYLALLTLSPTITIVAVMSVFRGYFQGFGDTVPTASSQMADQVFNAVFSVALAYIFMKLSSGDAVAAGAAGGTAGTGIGAAAGLFCMLFFYYGKRRSFEKKRLEQKRKFPPASNKSVAAELLSSAIPIIIGTAIFSMTNIIDTTMAQSRLSSIGSYTKEQIDALLGMLNGKYVTLSTLPVAISSAFAMAVIPSVAASRRQGDDDAVKSKINLALRLTMMVSIPAAVGLAVLGSPIIMMLFRKYPDGGYLVQVGSISVIFLSLAQISTGLLQALGRVRVPVLAALCGALVKIPLNYFLIGSAGINITGAVLSTTACYIVASVIDCAVLMKTTGIRLDFAGILLKPAFSAAFMGMTCYSVYVLTQNAGNTAATLLAVLAGFAVYGAFMLLTGGITRGDLRRFLKN